MTAQTERLADLMKAQEERLTARIERLAELNEVRLDSLNRQIRLVWTFVFLAAAALISFVFRA